MFKPYPVQRFFSWFFKLIDCIFTRGLARVFLIESSEFLLAFDGARTAAGVRVLKFNEDKTLERRAV
jgi:hypothetical protein